MKMANERGRRDDVKGGVVGCVGGGTEPSQTGQIKSKSQKGGHTGI